MSESTKKISKDLIVLMPVYEDRKSATQLVQQLSQKLGGRCYIIVVEDGSVDDPMRITDITAAGVAGEVLYLARNMGHQRAIAAGLTYIAITFEPVAVVVMDSDGEDRPDSLASLLGELQTGTVDAVVAQRARRSETLGFRIFYVFYRFIFQLLTGRTIRFGNFTALSAAGVRRLAAMQEVWLHLASSLMVSRLRIGFVPTDRGKRYFGRSQMNFVSLALHGMRSMMVFAEDVLVRIVLFCSVVAASSIMLLATTTTLKFLGFATPGWFSTLSGIGIVILFQAGILTFVTLMVAGTMRSAAPMGRDQLALLIERIDKGAPPVANVAPLGVSTA
jgi:glycosyltransferase involved in cell wall biosynthesis